MKVANGDLSFDEVMQELKSSAPVNQVKTLLSSVHGQLGRSGLLDALSSQKGETMLISEDRMERTE